MDDKESETVLFGFLKKMFVSWELIYSSTEAGKHFGALDKLSNIGIKYKTKTLNFGGGFGGGEGFNSVYHIYVPKSNINEANEAIHRR